jgi:hypothetical protein
MGSTTCSALSPVHALATHLATWPVHKTRHAWSGCGGHPGAREPIRPSHCANRTNAVRALLRVGLAP